MKREVTNLEKVNDLGVWIFGVLLAGVSWVFARLFKSVDEAHIRIDRIESQVVDRKYLESQMSPIRQDLNMILKHLLEHRGTEGQDKLKN